MHELINIKVKLSYVQTVGFFLVVKDQIWDKSKFTEIGWQYCFEQTTQSDGCLLYFQNELTTMYDKQYGDL